VSVVLGYSGYHVVFNSCSCSVMGPVITCMGDSFKTGKLS